MLNGCCLSEQGKGAGERRQPVGSLAVVRGTPVLMMHHVPCGGDLNWLE